jgi:gamma-tubulin complex component 3
MVGRKGTIQVLVLGALDSIFSTHTFLASTCYDVGLKGGALVSTLYAYSQHGDPDVKSLVKHLLNQVDQFVAL